MTRTSAFVVIAVGVALTGSARTAGRGARRQLAPDFFPANLATDVNPDTHLQLTFDEAPTLGSRGVVRLYDVTDGIVADTLDMAVPAGPADAGSRGALPAGQDGQRVVIGGFTEGFHFYPIIVHGTRATIYPHNHALTYGKTYRVEIDSDVFAVQGRPVGVESGSWTFSTRPTMPVVGDRIEVAADGRADFSTVQGAVDAVPDRVPRRVTIVIRNGTYEEIVYFRHKTNITFLGESRGGVVIRYANNERFNGPPPGVATNEKPGTFPYRRAVFMADRSSGIDVVNLSIVNDTPAGGGQAEALILSGGRNIVSRVTLRSHQDTLQLDDSAYVEDSAIEGDTDFLWGRGPAYFTRCDLTELSNGPFMWARNVAPAHGFVFNGCAFHVSSAAPSPGPFLARTTAAYPDSEVVLLDCALGLVNPGFWSLPAGTANTHDWDYRSTRLSGDAKAGPVVHVGPEPDAATIAKYRDPAFVLDGWSPSPPAVVH